MMLRLVCVVFLVGAVALQVEGKSARRRLTRSVENPTFTDCGKAGKYMSFLDLQFNPNPIVIPGSLSLTFHAVNNRTLPNMDIEVKMSRKGSIGNWEFDIPIPCVMQVGSCTYDDICKLMSEGSAQLEEDLPVLRTLRDALEASGAPSACPITPNNLNIRDLTIDLPQIPSMLSSMADGTYEVTYRILRHNTEQELGCLSVLASIKTPPKPKSCWWCG